MVSEIFLTNDEKDENVLAPDTLSGAVDQINRDGYLIVRNLLNPAKLETLRQRLDDEWALFKSNKPAWRGGGKIIGHLGLMPPKIDEFVCPEILSNPIILSIVTEALKDKVWITAFGGNINFPDSVDQRFHSDLEYPQTNKLMVNIPLGDVDERNGSLELIPGTHLDGGEAETTPVRANTTSGDVVIRYLHLMHRGKRNPAVRPRHMLGIWYTALSSGQTHQEPLCLDPASQDIFEDGMAQFNKIGQGRDFPVFQPNYFAPTTVGMIKEVIYRASPATYGLATRLLGR
jgi:hypothetical protein